jgi:hypothetical protein
VTVTPDSLDLEPADAAISDEALDVLAALLLDDEITTTPAPKSADDAE